MSQTKKKRHILDDTKGQGLTEYMILVLLISLTAIYAARDFGITLKGKIESADKKLRSKM